MLLRTVGNLRMDKTLFLLDPKCLDSTKLSPFYQRLFKIWSLFFIQKIENFHSIYWLLHEPLILKARLDISSSTFLPGLSRILQNSGVLVLSHLLSLTGPYFENVEAVTEKLGFRSVRLISQFLTRLKQALSDDEKSMLEDFFLGVSVPDSEDPFPCLVIQPNFEECSGFYFQKEKFSSVDFFSCTGKDLYKMCVFVLNRKALDKRVDTPWRSVLKLGDNVRPEWRVLYKPPLSKRTGDLQWRILHGAIAVNSFVSILDSKNDSGCPFCSQKETVFHAFMQCVRLKPLFAMIEGMCDGFDECFFPETFIFGFKYAQRKRVKFQLLNFILGQAKLAIYLSRKGKIEQKDNYNVVVVFRALLKARISIDFRFYKVMSDLFTFESKWCSNDVLCKIDEEELFFCF